MAKQKQPQEQRKLWIPEIVERFRSLGFQLREDVAGDGPENERILGTYELDLKPLPYFQDLGFCNPKKNLISLVRTMPAEGFLSGKVAKDFSDSLDEYVAIATPGGTYLLARFEGFGRQRNMIETELETNDHSHGLYIPCVPRELAKYVTEDKYKTGIYGGDFRADRFLKDLFDYALKYKK